ncbi:MAG: O-antigen polymerase [Acidobacteriales bacterium]|nr:O-antigen polymerase [Terriglobales bacterium]
MSNTPPVITIEASFREDKILHQPDSNTLRNIDSALFWGFCGLLLFGPLAFGAVEPWSIAVLQAGATLLFLLWCARQYLARAIALNPSPLYLPMASFATVVVAQWIFRITCYANATTTEASNYYVFAILIFIAIQLFASESRLRTFAVVIVCFGFALALFAILQNLTSDGLLYWVRRPRFVSPIYGPYVNRNHYAGLMEMLAPVGLALCFSRLFSIAMRALFGFAALVMGATIFLSGSRGGSSAFIAEMIFFALLSSSLKKSRRFHWGVAAFFLALVAFLFWIDLASVFDRWSGMQDELQAGRLAIARDCLKMFAQRPLLGWGLGTFPTIYPQFRSFYTDFFINQAHNDYLQILVETGLLGGIAMLWFIANLYRSCLGRLRNSHASIGSTVRLAAITGCTGLLIHSAADFNLHIPANAAMFYVLCAIAAAPSERRR